ncbi:helix-turn-helix transcriptional regulator [Leisingera sp. SS27]|uniref:helix-turn-helix domain-containing protein n=1 Tax=Leisingera sp. SS27 TaxID=2979462 RepID=UPI00232FA34B|nr:helix-turn-helix transcriptional regulator [Leisingera sp. SS27]MDC0657073.1 helix-turn-helix transcriptional regulator [Leisingera sp. SS27]
MSTSTDAQQQKSKFAQEMRPERIGQRLKWLRLALGFQPAEMADFLGIERTYWSRIEGGKRATSKELAAIIKERCHVTMDYIIVGELGGLPLDLANKITKIANQD